MSALLILQSACAQKTSGDFYTFKKDRSATQDLGKAAFMLHVFPLNDTTFVTRYYHFKGPMIRQESYKDSGLTIPHGRFCWYNEKGDLDSTGTVSEGRKDGHWEYIISKNETHEITYENGKQTGERTYRYDNKGKLIDEGALSEDEDTTKHKEVKAVYKTGVNDWVAYCQENLQTPERLQNVLGNGTHTSTVSFIINKKGYTSDIFLYQSCEWSGDAEVMRLIADSQQWQPATRDGEPVAYRVKQSLSFRVVSR